MAVLNILSHETLPVIWSPESKPLEHVLTTITTRPPPENATISPLTFHQSSFRYGGQSIFCGFQPLWRVLLDRSSNLAPWLNAPLTTPYPINSYPTRISGVWVLVRYLSYSFHNYLVTGLNGFSLCVPMSGPAASAGIILLLGGL